MRSGPSEKAMEAARNAQWIAGLPGPQSYLEAAVRAAHDPALGLDRSVCLRDVDERYRALAREAADLLSRAGASGAGAIFEQAASEGLSEFTERDGG